MDRYLDVPFHLLFGFIVIPSLIRDFVYDIGTFHDSLLFLFLFVALGAPSLEGGPPREPQTAACKARMWMIEVLQIKEGASYADIYVSLLS